ncbi:hypothetical protein CSV72_02305 [Sporosarcina sp. P20a]|uniref:DUF3800 domain-containing protein n=1 Tax=Sporosarcina sp. P20a TaxID=2048256 RepID=UPI000C165B47|nr:DUF3800 domain-containing protein [Sporosarcina sp. P20a]PIC88002.1 hypothetical protein CSV72_02305 [Sporosarcina sp. P20a]
MYPWMERPTVLEEWPENIDRILAIDENGIPELKSIVNPSNDLLQWFTITGVMLTQQEFMNARKNFVNLKSKYWNEGLFNGQRVVFHSRDIRKKIGAFNPRFVNPEDLKADIDQLLVELDYTIYTSSIDKFAHGRQYIYPYPVYDLCFEFVLERFCHELRNNRHTGLIVMESRGFKENQVLLKTAMNLLNKGNRYYSSDEFSLIKGIYFNPKRTKNKKLSFPMIELADLVSYPIHSYVRKNTEVTGFNIIKNKLYNHPNYSGFGMKIFPK